MISGRPHRDVLSLFCFCFVRSQQRGTRGSFTDSTAGCVNSPSHRLTHIYEFMQPSCALHVTTQRQSFLINVEDQYDTITPELIVTSSEMSTMKHTKNTWSWGHCSIILVRWQEFFLGKRVIKWFCELSDTYQEVREGHKQEGAECASCWPAVLYRADSLYHHNWHTHTQIHMYTKRQECFSTEIREKQTVRKDKQYE